MRSYPKNSPHAAGRILALVMLADSHASQTEIDAFLRLQAADPLGLQPEDVTALVQQLCEDLLAGQEAATPDLLPPRPVVDALLDELDDADLQHRVLVLGEELAWADGHLAAAEHRMLDRMRRRWQPSLSVLG